MTYRVAIAISGAVSLGSYEAGTLFELINAFKKHNETAQQDEQIIIDVITGASAGGMTAALVAQKLLFEASALDDPQGNVGYRAWVEEVDIAGLLTEHPDDNTTNSLLSSGFVSNIANSLILNRYINAPQKKERHSACGSELRLGLAMSNLNGVDYEQQIFAETDGKIGSGAFVETRYQDRFTTTLRSDGTGESDTVDTWQKVVDAAVACGAFPVAFSPRKIIRDWLGEDYEGLGAVDFSQKAFTFIDGGAFNNYPLGLAKKLVSEIDKDPLDYEKRFYFYISPNSKDSTALGIDLFDGAASGFPACLTQTAKAVFYQARFQDWINADKVNKNIYLLDARAASIAEYINGLSAESLASFSAVFTELAEQVFKPNVEDGLKTRLPDDTGDESFNEALARLTTQYEDTFASLNEAGKQCALVVTAVLEKAGNLYEREIMKVYTVTAEEQELASDKLYSFMGFMKAEFRKYDYLFGRIKARQMLSSLVKHSDTEQLPLVIDNLADYDAKTQVLLSKYKAANLGEAQMYEVEFRIREAFYSRVKDRYYLVAKQIGLNYFLAIGLFNFFIKSRLKKVLWLRRQDQLEAIRLTKDGRTKKVDFTELDSQ